jgi:hypothetical protein
MFPSPLRGNTPGVTQRSPLEKGEVHTFVRKNGSVSIIRSTARKAIGLKLRNFSNLNGYLLDREDDHRRVVGCIKLTGQAYIRGI